jgi:hypothetical protein
MKANPVSVTAAELGQLSHGEICWYAPEATESDMTNPFVEVPEP